MKFLAIVLLIIASSCTVGKQNPDQDFYFSWNQFHRTHQIKYCQHRSGKIFIYTDATDLTLRHKYGSYKDAIYVGRGTEIAATDQIKQRAIWPANPRSIKK